MHPPPSARLVTKSKPAKERFSFLRRACQRTHSFPGFPPFRAIFPRFPPFFLRSLRQPPPSPWGFVATRPTFGPILILSTFLKGWGSPTWQRSCSHPSHLGPLLILTSSPKHGVYPKWHGLCSHSAHWWATCDFCPALKPWRPPRRQGLCSHPAQLFGNSELVPGSKAFGTSRAARVM